MKLPSTSAMMSSMYDLATSLEEASPKRGKRKSGDMDVTAMGTASVIHHKNTHESTASMLRLEVRPPRSRKKNMTMHERGPETMNKFFKVRSDLKGWSKLCGG